MALHLGGEERPGPATSTASGGCRRSAGSLAQPRRAVCRPYVWPNFRAAGGLSDAENPTCPARADCYDSFRSSVGTCPVTGFSGGDAPSDRGTIAKMGKRAKVSYRLTFLPVSTNAWLTNLRKPADHGGKYCSNHLLTENIGQQHPRYVLRARFLLARLRLRQSVAALCLLSVAFAAAFHVFVPSGTAWHSRSVPAVYTGSDHTAPCSDHLIVEGCHVHVYGVIASSDVEVGPDHEQASPLTAAPLVSFQPKMTGPPPKA